LLKYVKYDCEEIVRIFDYLERHCIATRHILVGHIALRMKLVRHECYCKLAFIPISNMNRTKE